MKKRKNDFVLLKMKNLPIFFLFFLLVQKFQHFHNVMAIIICHHGTCKQQTSSNTNNKRGKWQWWICDGKKVHPHNKPSTCHSQGVGDGGSTWPKHMQ